MIIKKFTAKTEEEATALAKAELGENVVIMNVRNADKRSFPWVVKRKQVEVTVAKEEENVVAAMVVINVNTLKKE